MADSNPQSSPEDVLREMGYSRAVEPASSGIDLVIAGCGFAGIACAIESVRKGHSVTVLEKHDEMLMIGRLTFFVAAYTVAKKIISQVT